MAFLGVDISLTGRCWVGPDASSDRLTEAMMQQTGLPRALSGLLVQRGVTAEASARFLAPQLRDLLPDPRSLKDAQAAASRVLQAVKAEETIAIFADYDVDGGSSAALLIWWLRQMGRPATLYVPDRLREGYGPNSTAMNQLAADHTLILCVDCGTVSHEAFAEIKGADIIVLDHHLGGETLPAALAVVNPNRQDETGDLAHLCAASVVFLLLVEMGRQLREAGTTGPNLMAMLDLVALATVADVAPLIGVNRALVRQGLKVMARRERPGLVALADIAKMDSAPNTSHLGFAMAPRINAGGRIGKSDLGARLLACRDPQEAQSIAEHLDTLNTQRRDIEQQVRDAAMLQVETRGIDGPLVWAAGQGWHPGVVGIVAARIKEVTNRPTVIIGIENGEGKGSGRSISGVDLGVAVQRLATDGTLTKGGGHKMAAGLSLPEDQIETAMARLSELLAKQGGSTGGPKDLRLDGMLMPAAATVELIEHLETVGPFGAAAPAPRFGFVNMRISYCKRIGSAHLKLRFGDPTGAQLEGIAFGAFDSPMGAALEAHSGALFHLAGRLDINEWRGRKTAQLRVEDAAPATAINL
jgi:single-stranded-DNA-specific exonuclease